MPRSRRSNYTPEEIKKRQDKLFGFDKKRPKAQYEKNRAKNTGGGSSKKTSEVSTLTKQGKKRTPAQMLAAKRIAAKKAGTYKKPKTAQELAKERLKIKNKKK